MKKKIDKAAGENQIEHKSSYEIAFCEDVDVVTVWETLGVQRNSAKANLVTQMKKMGVIKRMKVSQKKAHWQKSLPLKKLSDTESTVSGADPNVERTMTVHRSIVEIVRPCRE